MQTKDQEREALKKLEAFIKKNIDPDGYVAAALAGVIELASNNIGNDFLQSFPERLESAHKAELASNAKVEELRRMVETEKVHTEYQRQRVREEQEKSQKLREVLDVERERRHEAEEERREYIAELAKKAEQEAEYIEEITKLKARLFDLMTAAA